jgi:signal transduction histidine kinase
MIRSEFRGNKLFKGVEPGKLEALDIEIVGSRFAPGEVLFEEGAVGDELVLIASGSVRLTKVGRGGEQELLDLAGAGEFIGEMAVIDRLPRSAQATAAAETVTGSIAWPEVTRLISQAPVVAMNIGRTAIARLRHADQHFIEQLLESERLSLLGRMMGAIVHDFRNPINTILQATYYMNGRQDIPMIPKLSAVIEESVNRMLHMTQEMLDFSRGVNTVNLEETTVESLLASIEDECLAQLPASGIELVRAIGYGGTVEIDRHRFQRLLLNLIKNAREAMPSGGRLTVSTACAGDAVLISVADTGCGIPPEIASTVFEPFVTHGKPHGTGLGLSIAKAVVDAHHGTIRAESAEGVGTTFHITVPKTRAAPPA